MYDKRRLTISITISYQNDHKIKELITKGAQLEYYQTSLHKEKKNFMISINLSRETK